SSRRWLRRAFRHARSRDRPLSGFHAERRQAPSVGTIARARATSPSAEAERGVISSADGRDSMTRSLALALALGACASSEQTHAWDTTAPPASTGGSDADHQKLIADGDAGWAQRADRAQLEKAITAYEAATKMKSDDWQTWVKLDHAVYFMA